ncbi:tetratricopeptide repeat protein [Qipengyuania aestuarii]|uniref:tetratricopeptide repeat protein n=1 Tax=Qipengyuania aestuarii TaxID=2867241 RepID=UPI001FFC8245|nr:tetratricopeptide repeat protein [Qipengyuania aestuarii]
MRASFCIVALAFGASLHSAPSFAQARGENRAGAIQSAEAAQAEGNYSAARRLLLDLLAENPDDPDLLRRLARVEAAAGRLDVALNLIDRAATIAPHDLDIALARAYILYWRGDLKAAKDVTESIAAREPDYPDLAALQASLRRAREDSGIRLRALSVGGGVSDITLQSGASRTWNTQNIVAAFDLSAEDTLAVSLSREERSAIDMRGGVRLDHRIADGSVYITATAVPNADFQENWSLGAGGELLISGRTAALMDVRLADYDTGEIVSVQPGLRVPLGSDFSLTGRAINIFGGGESYRLGGSIRLDFQRDSHPSFFALAASYPDAEAGDVRQLRSVAAGMNVPVSERLSLSATGSHEDRKDSYRRWAGNLALTYRFDRR